MNKQIDKAEILVEALPYIRAFSGKTIVIKYGGKAMVEEELKEQFAQDVVLMKYVGINPVVVHGGGPQISQMMKRWGKEPVFVEGVRVTDAETMKIVEMVLGGVINKEIVALIHRQGGKAVGLTGKDGRLITAKPLKSAGPHGEKRGAGLASPSAGRGGHLPAGRQVGGATVPDGPSHKRTDLGLVGEVESIDPQVLASLEEARFIPIIAPVGAGKDGKTYNINADWVAGAIAASLKAEKLLILTDVAGILNNQRKLIPTLSKKELSKLIKRGVINEGMLPKVQACLTALEGGVSKTHIIDGRTRHALLLEIFTDQGIGTEIVA
jgi:acetylglutamate kinase